MHNHVRCLFFEWISNIFDSAKVSSNCNFSYII